MNHVVVRPRTDLTYCGITPKATGNGHRENRIRRAEGRSDVEVDLVNRTA